MDSSTNITFVLLYKWKDIYFLVPFVSAFRIEHNLFTCLWLCVWCIHVWSQVYMWVEACDAKCSREPLTHTYAHTPTKTCLKNVWEAQSFRKPDRLLLFSPHACCILSPEDFPLKLHLHSFSYVPSKIVWNVNFESYIMQFSLSLSLYLYF